MPSVWIVNYINSIACHYLQLLHCYQAIMLDERCERLARVITQLQPTTEV